MDPIKVFINWPAQQKSNLRPTLKKSWQICERQIPTMALSALISPLVKTRVVVALSGVSLRWSWHRQAVVRRVPRLPLRLMESQVVLTKN